MLYAGLARQGTTTPLNVHFGAPPPQALRLMEPVAAWYVGNVLIGSPPPENGTPGRIAFKTGTSYGYRDAWSLALTASTPSGCGWAGPTARQCRDWSGASRRRLSV